VLLPADMLPFIFHGDASVRRFAMDFYFSDAHDPGLTADVLWAAADRVHGDERLLFTKYLPSFPSTPASVERIFDLLRSERDERLFHHLCAAVEHLPSEEVRRALGDPKIARRLPAIAKARFVGVLELAGQSFDDLWRIVETCNVEIKAGRWLVEPTLWRVNRLAEALARSPEQAAGRALDALLDAPVGRRTRWVQTFAARLLCNVRHAGALVPLLALAGDREVFFIASDWAEDALVHLGTTEVVAATAAGFSSGGEWFRWHAGHVLGRIKRPESEKAVMRLLAASSDVTDCTRLGMALCALCTTSPDALDRLRALVNGCHFDPSSGELDEALLMVCAVQGFQPVEAPAWREQIVDREDALRAETEEYERASDATSAPVAGGERKRWM
jgi:hypothetical protein